MAAKVEPIEICQGRTFTLVVRWEELPIVYKAITGISQTAPVQITAVGHGAPEGWRAAVVSAQGMTEINAPVDSKGVVKEAGYHKVTVVGVDTVEFNDVNASEFTPWTSGGYLQYYTPVDLTGFTAKMDIKDKIGGTLYHSLTDAGGDITINNTDKTITLTITAADTAAFTWKKGVYDLELISGDATPVVTALVRGNVSVVQEVSS